MVRNYERKTSRGQSGSMPRAIELMKSGHSLRKAAMEAGVNHVTLSRRWKLSNSGGYQQPRLVFSNAQELELQEYLITCSRMSHGLTPLEVRKLAYDYASGNGLRIPDSWQRTGTAGKDWLTAFMKRSGSLSIRKPEATSLGRATSFNKHNVSTFFANLKEALSTNKIQPGRIWNMDETKITTVHKPPRVVGDKKIKQLGQVTSAERGVLVTGVCCVSSLGASIPPAFIWPRKTDRNTDGYMRGTPTNSLGLVHETGWMTAPNFELWMSHFLKHAKPSHDDPILLLLDNHQSHMSYKAIAMAKAAGVVMLTFPPHTTHRLQPLDVSVYGPYQTYYNVACNNWQVSNPGKTIGLYSIGELAGMALLRALTPENIINGFRKTGVHPLDENVFSEVDFLPSAVTDRDVPVETTANLQNENEISSKKRNNDSPSQHQRSTSLVQAVPHNAPSPSDLRPFPKVAPRKAGPKRQKGASVILTKTPTKNHIEEMANKVTSKKGAKRATKRKIVLPEESETSEDEDVVPLVESDTDECTDDPRGESAASETTSVTEGSFVVVQYVGKRKRLMYVAIVEQIEDEMVSVKFMKKIGLNDFVIPENPETDTIDMNDIVNILPNPAMISGTARSSAKRRFNVDLSHIDG